MAGSYWDKFTERRISRRRALQGIGVAGASASAIWLVGCGGGDDDDEPSGTPGTGDGNGDKPRPGGRYQVGSTADFDTFDPYIGIAASVAYFPRLYNVLVNFSALDSSFRFDDLSSQFEQPDDTTYVFTIRPGVKVSPNALGVPERDLTAEDIVASYERIKTLPQSNAYGFIGQWLTEQTANPDGTYTLKTKSPYAYFRNRIGSGINTIVAREALADAVLPKLKQQAAGAGPYMLRSYTEGQGAALDRNPNYYRRDEKNENAQIPYAEGIDVRIIADKAAQKAAFQSGQLDIYTATNVDESKQLEAGSNYTVVRDPVNTFIAFSVNVTKKPWDDDRIRKAALYAINREEYIDKVYRGEAKANGLVHWPQGDLAFTDDELNELQPFDPAQSRELIRAATGNDTVKVKVMWPADSAIEEHNLHLPIWLEQMKAAGFDVEQDPQPFATWLDNYTNLNYDASLALNQVYEYAEFNMDFQHSEGPARNNIYTTGVGRLYPEIDAAIDDAKTKTDPEEFKQAMHDLQRLIYEKGPSFMPIVSPYSFTLYSDRMKDVPQGLGASALFVNTWWIDA
jgi:peptide/nickel transport system substrate-binding protein